MSQSGFRITYPALLRGVVLFALVGCDEPFDEGEDILDAEGIATATQALCSQPQLASSSPGPMPPSSSVLLTASGVTCSPPGQTAEYRFLYQRVGSGSGFTQFRGWSTNRTATFSNAGRPSGQYRLQVRVRNVGSSQPFDSSAIITIMSGNVCHAVALTAAPAPPQLPGTLVALTASATCTPGPAEYRFLYRRPGESTLRNLRGWGGRTFSWNTAGRAIGEHELVVRARAAGNASYESSASIPYRLGIPNRPPTITSNGGGSVANLSVYENMPPSVATVVATDPDPGDTVTYSISGGSDAARFTIQPWGDLAFVGGPPDYETPADANGDNVYEVEVQASDGALADLQLLVITVTDVFDDPIPVTVLEGLTFVTNVVRIHPGMPLPVTTYQIVGGADAAQFTIDATTGRLSFVAPPEYEAPADVGLDNVYEVTVRLLDGFFLEEQRFRVAVTDFAEGGSPISVAIPENTTEVTAVVPRHPALLSPLTFSITGGLDAQFFTIDAMSGRLSFAQPPDYEWPLNARFSVPFLRTVNVYEVEVGITDGSLTETQPFLVIVTDVFEPFLHSVPENQVGVTVISARSRIQCFGGCLFWGFGIVGGSDAQRFEIDQVSGQLSGGLRFAIPVPDYERPMDANGDNVYEVAIRVLGIGAISNHEEIQVLHVTVTNVNTPDDFPVGHVIAENQSTLIVPFRNRAPASSVQIVNGADHQLFTIQLSPDREQAVLSFVVPPDFEQPLDADRDNRYEVNLVHTNEFNGVTSYEAQSVFVMNVDEPPVFSTAERVSVPENTTFVLTVTATDPERTGTVSYAIAGGADASRFALDPGAGTLSFLAAPDFESPADTDGDNLYVVTVQASDGQLVSTMGVGVRVTDVGE